MMDVTQLNAKAQTETPGPRWIVYLYSNFKVVQSYQGFRELTVSAVSYSFTWLDFDLTF